MSSTRQLPRRRLHALALLAFAPLVATAPLSAQAPAGTPEKLGTVHFATSCATAVAPQFDRAVALLHSFEFGAAITGFNAVAAADPNCAMAHWGLAMSRWTNPMSVGIRAPAALAPGRQAAQTAARLAANQTQRERDWADAVGQLYLDYETRDQRTRVLAYASAMKALVAKYPSDSEAKIFYAIALTASASPTDKTYASQLEAGAILESLQPTLPDHPGLTHYIIHTYDVPALAARARAAAVRYADLAPSAAHALHMPSHTFTRVGMWQESVSTNLRSMQSAEAISALGEALHAADYAVYAWMQMRDEASVQRMLARLPDLAARFNPAVVTGAAPGVAGFFGLAAMPARYALERGAWGEATVLRPTPTEFLYPEALTWFARGLGAARSNNTATARAAADTLAALSTRLTAKNEAYWAEQVAIQRIAVEAWLELAAGRREQAITRMREAATREDATEKAAVTPGPLAPARELLAEMLLEVGRPSQALAEFRTALTREPNRYRSLDGARRAAVAAGDQSAAREYERLIAALTGAR